MQGETTCTTATIDFATHRTAADVNFVVVGIAMISGSRTATINTSGDAGGFTFLLGNGDSVGIGHADSCQYITTHNIFAHTSAIDVDFILGHNNWNRLGATCIHETTNRILAYTTAIQGYAVFCGSAVVVIATINRASDAGGAIVNGNLILRGVTGIGVVAACTAINIIFNLGIAGYSDFI